MNKHDFSAKVKQREKNEAGGVCRICTLNTQVNPIQHYHHIKGKGRGGLGIQINCLGVCFKCHDKIHRGEIHTDKDILKQRIDRLFQMPEDWKYNELTIAVQLYMNIDKLRRQINKRFLDTIEIAEAEDICIYSCTKEQISRWLGAWE